MFPNSDVIESFFYAASAQTKDSIELLKRMGVPVIQVQLCFSFHHHAFSFLKFFFILHTQNSAFQAPGDAEAQCARLVRDGVVDAVASEDMDTLPFGANVLIRQLNAKKDRCGLLKLQYVTFIKMYIYFTYLSNLSLCCNSKL